MNTHLVRTAVLLRRGAIALLAVRILLVLFTGGYQFTLGPFASRASRIAPPLIVLLLLALASFPFRRSRLSLQGHASHGAAALFAVALVVYLASGSTHGSGDTVPARYLPLSILRERNLDLDEFRFLRAADMPYYLKLVNGHYVSDYPVAPALLALPFYLPSALAGVPSDSPFIAQLEKLAAAVIVSISVAVLYLLLRELTTGGTALVISLIYAFGSSSLSVSSQALWQHGPAQLAIVTALYSLIRARDQARWAILAGFALAFAVICRPVAALIVLPLIAHEMVHRWRRLAPLVLGALPPLVFQVWYNATYFGNPWRMQFSGGGGEFWSTPLGDGLLGILLSPGRGLFVYSPIFVLSFVGLALSWRKGADPLLRYLSIGTLLSVLLYSRWVMWWGGHSYGPRLLADLTPILALSLCALSGAVARSRLLKSVVIVLVAWSVVAHALGTFWGDYSRWNGHPDVDRFPHRLWSWSESPLVESAGEVAGRPLIIILRLPTSETRPELLSASLTVLDRPIPPPSLVTVRAKPLERYVRATNDGRAVWLSTAGRGQVMLGWRWLTSKQGVPAVSGLEPLRHDVFPRRSYEFLIGIDTPHEPGAYELEVGLVTVADNRTHSFAKLVVPSISMVVPASPDRRSVSAFLTDLPGTASPHPTPSSPTAAIKLNASQFRPGDKIRISLEVHNSQDGPARDLYVGVLFPDGVTAMFFSSDGRPTPPRRLATRREFVRTMSIPPGFVLDRPIFVEGNLPSDFTPGTSGTYEFFVAITRHRAFEEVEARPGDVVAANINAVTLSR